MKYRVYWNIVERPEKDRRIVDIGKKLFDDTPSARNRMDAMIGEFLKKHPKVTDRYEFVDKDRETGRPRLNIVCKANGGYAHITMREVEEAA